MKMIMRIVTLIFLLVCFAISFTQAQTHRRWSHRKKDAVIGGVVGAGTGAIISHDKSKGAIVGGVLGAGAGYLHGRHKDKKTGRLK
jgi:hypothetical protein